MRFDEITLMRYGEFERLDLRLSPGLNVVYGPNMAGKSTCLQAVRDFLFGIPERSPRSARFGSDAVRIGARLTTRSGEELSLRRRRGRGRTLVDDAGAVRDDDVVATLLGAVDRERFATLFGLDHEGLRRGGEALLSAQGDVGRLVVEAGGGLRELVRRLDGLDREVDSLFAPRRKEGRAFYKALSAFEAADAIVRANLLTREAYERDRRAVAEAATDVARLRAERRGLGEQSFRMARLGRVVPLLRGIETAEVEEAAFEDVRSLRDGFADACGAALDGRDAAAEASVEARRRRSDVRARRDAESFDQSLAAAEAEVRDVEVGLATARTGRRDKALRVTEAEEADGQLELLRVRLGVGRRTDLEPLVPSPDVTRAVRELAERDAAIRLRVDAARESVVLIDEARTGTAARLAAFAALGHDQPSGIDASTFATLPSDWASAVARVDAAADLDRVARDRAREIGFDRVDRLRLLACPDGEQVRAESRTRDVLRTERARAASAVAGAVSELDAARAETAASLAAGDGPTGEDVADARRRRDVAWTQLSASYLGQGTPVSQEDRPGIAERFGALVADADGLADARGAEAGRVAALAAGRRRTLAAERAVQVAARLLQRLDRDLDEADQAFRRAFPEACVLVPELPALAAFAAARRGALEASTAATEARRAGEAALRHLDPIMRRFERAESKAGSPSPAPTDLVDRVQAVSAAIGAHDRAHEAYRGENEALVAIERDLRAAEREAEDADRERVVWFGAWAEAAAALGLSPDGPVGHAAELARMWEQARGDLRALGQARAIVDRAEVDEETLAARASSLAGRLGLSLPEDPVAAGEMLVRLWGANDAARVRRDVLEPEVLRADDDAAKAERALVEADARLAALAAEAGEAGRVVDVGRLRTLASRRRALGQLWATRDGLAASARSAGDGLDLATLRQEAGGLDLDVVRAEAADVVARVERADERIEAAIREQVRAEAALRGRERDGAVGAFATREAAVADLHEAASRYVELKVARALLAEGVRVVRDERQDPMVRDAGGLFSRMTRGEFDGVAADVDERGTPVVVGVRSHGLGPQPVAAMSDGTRDQLFLAFRLASLAAYCAVAEPLPFVGDDLLVHFDDDRTETTLGLLAEFGARTQVLLFTHHRSVRDAAATLAREGRATVVDVSA